MRWGVILALATIFLTVIIYVLDYTVLVQFKLLLLFLVLFLGILIYAGINYRSSIGGYISYGDAFKHGFVLLVISGLIGTVFNVLLYNVIDPDLPAKLTDAAMENARQMMERFGAPPDGMDEALEKAKADTAARFTILGTVKGFLWGLILYAVVVAITSLFVRKNEPIEM